MWNADLVFICFNRNKIIIFIWCKILFIFLEMMDVLVEPKDKMFEVSHFIVKLLLGFSKNLKLFH